LQNFREVVTSYYFWRSLWSTTVFAVMAVLAVTLYGLGAALLLNQPVFGGAPLKVVILLPWGIPAVLSRIILRWRLHRAYRVPNRLLLATGAGGPYLPRYEQLRKRPHLPRHRPRREAGPAARGVPARGAPGLSRRPLRRRPHRRRRALDRLPLRDGPVPPGH